MRKCSRWGYALAGFAALFCCGVIYAWSVLSAPIAAEFPLWTKAQLSMTFTITIIFFCLGCMLGGSLSSRIDPRVYILASAVLFLVGFRLTAAVQGIAVLYIGFGIVSGTAAGIGYNAVMSTITKWFPDRQGLISGILLMGFGLSAFVTGKLYQALTPDTAEGWRASFRVMSLVLAAVLAICAPFFRRPDATFLKSAAKKKSGAGSMAPEITTGEMLRKGQFWLYYLWTVLLSAAGLALVSQANGSAVEVGPSTSAGTVATVVGLISVFNALGRVASGILYDKRGCGVTMHTVSALFLVTGAVLMLALSLRCFPLLILGFILGGLFYGGVPPVNSAFISSHYGQKHYALNFSVINTNMVFASFGSTAAGALFDASGSYFATYLFMTALALTGIVITCCMKREGAK